MFSAPSPFSLIIFGASGHLAQLKLYPALYILAQKERLPEHYSVIGYARSKMDDGSFRDMVEASIRKNIIDPNEGVLKEFLDHVFYNQGNYDNEQDFVSLGAKLDELENGWKEHTRLAYFSVPPIVYSVISKNLCKGGIHKKDIAFRCIVEKPVGDNLKSFEEVKKQLLGCFTDDEIYLLHQLSASDR